MHGWYKSKFKRDEGKGSRIEYRSDDFPGVSANSCLEEIPHANRVGTWTHKYYTVETDDGKFKKQFTTLGDAFEFVQNGGLK